MSDMRMFAQITKVDEAKRLVYTRVVDETPDRADERFDYAKSKPYFEAWSKNQFDASGGKSYGNVRAMHGKVAAGVISEPLSFSDTNGTIDAAFKIVDDQEWAKVLAGVYTGASIGGSYVGGKTDEKIGDRTVKRYVANPVEVSLVDSPCVPTAKFFDIVKADGVTEKRAFKLADTEYKIEGTEEQIEQFAKDMATHKMTMADVLKLIADAKVAPVKAAETEVEKTVREAMESVVLAKRLADPDLPVSDFVDIAKAHGIDVKTLKRGDIDGITKQILEKAKMTAANMDRLQAAHDHLASMGAECGGADKSRKSDLVKSDVDEMKKALTEAQERIKKLESQPVPYVTLRAVARATQEVKKQDQPAADEVAVQVHDLLK